MTDLLAQRAHRDFVSGVLFYYAQNDIRPRDPNEGSWEAAHYPKPKRLGGTETIWLLKEHHAIQGVLQSEEYGCCCTSGRYGTWLKDTEYEQLYSRWLRAGSADGGKIGGARAYQKRGKKHIEAANEARRKKVVVSKERYSEEFESLSQACRKLGLSKSALCLVIKGARQHHKGYTAHYA